MKMKLFDPDTDCSVWIARLNASRTISWWEFYVKTAIQSCAILPAIALLGHQWYKKTL